MSTFHLSLPEHLARHVAAQAEAEQNPAEDYIVGLIARDWALSAAHSREALAAYLAHCDQQITDGRTGRKTLEELIAEGEARYDRRHAAD